MLGMKYLPANSQKSSNQRFDPTSAVMNALTFGLLITAISGFAQGQSLLLIAAEIAALLVIGYFFVRRQLRQTSPLLPVESAAHPYFCAVDGHLDLLFCRPDAGYGVFTLLPAGLSGP